MDTPKPERLTLPAGVTNPRELKAWARTRLEAERATYERLKADPRNANVSDQQLRAGAIWLTTPSDWQNTVKGAR